MHAQSIHSVSSATPRGLKGSYFLTHPAWTCLEKLLHFFTVIALLYSAFDIARLDKSVRSGFYEPCGNRVAGCVSLADLTAIHSMIGYRHHPVVRLSIRLSLSVTLCIVALRVGVWCKNCTSVFLAGKFACQFRHFCCRTYRLGKKRTGKKRVEENANVRHRKPCAHWFIAHYLLWRTWEDRHRELCLTRLSGLSLGAFIKSNRLNRIARLF